MLKQKQAVREMAPENEIQKNWKEPIFDSDIADLILRLEPSDVKRFNAFQDLAPNG